jgi:DNA-binding MarR family transcriptional regulator
MHTHGIYRRYAFSVAHDQDIETLIVAAHALTRVAALETANETPAAQWRTLTILRDQGALRVGELARLSRVTQPGMTRLIGQMADQGLVRKTADAADSRATVVEVTSLGHEALQTWMLQLTTALSPHFDDLTPEEWSALRTTASVLARKLDRTRAAAPVASTEDAR